MSMPINFLVYNPDLGNTLLCVTVYYGLHLVVEFKRVDSEESLTPVLRMGFPNDSKDNRKLVVSIFENRNFSKESRRIRF